MFQLIQLLKYMHFDEDNYGSLWQVVLNLRNFPDNNLYENISKYWLVESREFPRKYSAKGEIQCGKKSKYNAIYFFNLLQNHVWLKNPLPVNFYVCYFHKAFWLEWLIDYPHGKFLCVYYSSWNLKKHALEKTLWVFQIRHIAHSIVTLFFTGFHLVVSRSLVVVGRVAERGFILSKRLPTTAIDQQPTKWKPGFRVLKTYDVKFNGDVISPKEFILQNKRNE